MLELGGSSCAAIAGESKGRLALVPSERVYGTGASRLDLLDSQRSNVFIHGHPTMSGRQGVLDAIDFAVDGLGVESFASLDNTPDNYGEHVFYAIEKPAVRAGVLADVRTTRRPGDQLLSVIERAAEHPGMRVVEGDAFARDTIAEIGTVGAVLVIDVLLHAVDPDWDRLLELYAPATSCFVIVNPQWPEGEETIRLVDLGREGFARVVPPYPSQVQLFDRIDEWYPAQRRPFRDARFVWQWGITDADLEAKLRQLKFSLVYRAGSRYLPGDRGVREQGLRV